MPKKMTFCEPSAIVSIEKFFSIYLLICDIVVIFDRCCVVRSDNKIFAFPLFAKSILHTTSLLSVDYNR